MNFHSMGQSGVKMSLTELDVIPVIKSIFEREIEAKKQNAKHKIFISEKELIDQLNPQSDEDIRTIRICASSSVDTMNAVSDSFYKIDTDINEYDMARARAYRKSELEGTILPKPEPSRERGSAGTTNSKQKAGCLTIMLIGFIVITVITHI